MTFTSRTVLGGLIVGLVSLVLTFMQITEEAGVAIPLSFILPVLTAALVAYYVFGSVKHWTHRLGAAVGVAPIFLVLIWSINELLAQPVSQLSAVFGIIVWAGLIAAAFIAAVTAVVWIAARHKITLVVS